MTQAVQIFNHPDFGDVRVIELNGEVLFVGKDVAIALGYSNPRKALADHVPDKYKKDGVTIRDSMGREQTPTLITEAGLYKLIMRSKLPNAERFSDWTCEEVLPSIRKTGLYIDPNAPIEPDFLRRIADEIDRRTKKIALLETQLAEAKPKVDYCDLILQCPDLVTTSAIAKDYGMSAKKFNQLLRDLGVQFYQSGMWLLYQKYARLGWSSTKTYPFTDERGKTHCKVHTYWTQKGRLGLYDLLKKKNYFPTIEKEAVA